MERPHVTEEEWRHYDRSLGSWPSGDNRRRWPNTRKETREGAVKPRGAEPATAEDSRSKDSADGAQGRSDPPVAAEAPSEPKAVRKFRQKGEVELKGDFSGRHSGFGGGSEPGVH